MMKKPQKKEGPMSYSITIQIPRPGAVAACVAAGIAVLTALYCYNILKPADVAIIFATFFGPIFAVAFQAARDAERQKKAQEQAKHDRQQERQLQVFRQMMALRATPVDNIFVQGFNCVPVDFHDSAKVISAWKAVFAHLNQNPPLVSAADFDRLNDLRATLLYEMSQTLGYGLTMQELKYESYSPMASANDHQIRTEVIQGLHRVLANGEIPIRVVGITTPP